jgi:hypothetical protein
MFLVVSLKNPSKKITLFEILNDNIQSIRLFESMNDVKNCHKNYYIWTYSIKADGWAEMNRVVNTDPSYGGTTLQEIISEPMDKVTLELDNEFLYQNKNVADIIRDLKLSLILIKKD